MFTTFKEVCIASLCFVAQRDVSFREMLREIEMDSVFSSCRCSNVKDAIRAFFVSGLGTTGAGAGAGAGGGAGRGAL